MTLLALIFCAALGIIFFPVVSPRFALLAIFCLRVLSDVGAASTGSLLPSSIIAGGLSIAAIVACFIPSPYHIPPRARSWIALLVAIVLSFTVIALANGGPPTDSTLAGVRWLSFIAIGVLAFRAARTGPSSSVMLSPIILASCASVVGAVFQLAAMVQAGGRVAGTFSHANTAGAFFAIGVVVALEHGMRSKAKSAYIAVLMSGIGLLLTESVSSLLAAALGVVVLIVVSASLSTVRKVTLIAFGACASVAGVVLSGISSRLTEFETTDISAALASGTSANSLEWRFINWQFYIHRLSESPILGFGLGANERYAPLGAPPHSVFIQTAYDFGVLGSTAFVLLIFFGFRLLRSGAPAAVPISSALLAFCLVNGFASNLIGYTAAVYLAIAAIGLQVGRRRSAFVGPDFPAAVRGR